MDDLKFFSQAPAQQQQTPAQNSFALDNRFDANNPFANPTPVRTTRSQTVNVAPSVQPILQQENLDPFASPPKPQHARSQSNITSDDPFANMALRRVNSIDTSLPSLDEDSEVSNFSDDSNIGEVGSRGNKKKKKKRKSKRKSKDSRKSRHSRRSSHRSLSATLEEERMEAQTPVEVKDPNRWAVKRWEMKTSMGLPKTVVTWNFVLDGVDHTCNVHHSTFSGKRHIRVDGKSQLIEKKFFDNGGRYGLNIGVHPLVVNIIAHAMHFTYDLEIGGLPFDVARSRWINPM